jgi:hypothetical protein
MSTYSIALLTVAIITEPLGFTVSGGFVFVTVGSGVPVAAGMV